MSASRQYEYLDHTADIQLHSWGATLEEAIGHCVVAMYGYMTADITTVQPAYTMDFRAEGDDLCSLVYNLLDACLYRFVTEPFFIGMRCEVMTLEKRDSKTMESVKKKEGASVDQFTGVADEERYEEFQDAQSVYRIHLRVWGDSFDKERHPPGTEVKAITYSNLQVIEPHGEKADQRTADDDKPSTADDKSADDKGEGNVVYTKHNDKYNIFVIVDI